MIHMTTRGLAFILIFSTLLTGEAVRPARKADDAATLTA
jgi:hypothetical protein